MKLLGNKNETDIEAITFEKFNKFRHLGDILSIKMTS